MNIDTKEQFNMSVLCFETTKRHKNNSWDFCFTKGEKYPDFSTDDTTSFKTPDGIIENVV